MSKHTWNHRVIHHKGDGTVLHPDWYGIHEVHYTDDVPTSATVDPINVTSEEGVDGLRETLERMLRCLDKSVLEWEDFK